MKLTILESQFLFTANIVKLINYGLSQGIKITLGEVMRTAEQQRIYINKGVSKTMNSYHLKCLALDVKVYVNGVYSQSPKDYAVLAIYWEQLHVNNRAGYFWGWDLGHFEMQQDKAPRNK